MPCFHPIEGYAKVGGGLTFRRALSNGNKLSVPCGQCIGCRVDYSKMWAARMVHESRLHQDSIFITLTYDPEFLPTGGTLVKSHLQKFFKRLRKHTSPRKIRYYACGEYGDQNLRPHYHAIVYGWRFSDARLLRDGGGHRFYDSDTLTRLWGLGLCEFGEVTAETCAYTARYVIKKINGDRAKNHYQRVTQDGQLHDVLPEFSLMSLKPAIGKNWFETFRSDVFPDDFVILNGHRSKVPRYYDRLLDADCPELLEHHKQLRKDRAKARKWDSTPERLQTREAVMRAKLAPATRTLPRKD